MENDKQATLLITCFHGIISKNVLNTDALKILAEKGWNIVILVPEHKVELFRKYFSFPNISFEGIDVDWLVGSKRNNALLYVARLLVDSHYLWYKKQERLKANPSVRNRIKFFAEIAATKIFSRSKLAHQAFRVFDGLVNEYPMFRDCLAKYKPTALFATDIFEKVDAAFMAEAKRLKVPVIGMVRSWDNCWSKGLLRTIPDRVLVNNEIIKQEVVKLHDIKPETVEIVGLPQFDIFLKPGTLKTKQDFFKEIGADPTKKLIMFSPVGEPLSHTDWQILDMLQKNGQNGRIKSDFRILVRLHPGREMPLGKLEAGDKLIFDKPGMGLGKEVEFLPDDSLRLANSLYHCDLLIWIATTLGIDSAVYDKPQIVVNFDGYEKLEYIDSVRRYHDEDHMKRMLASGGVKVVISEEGLIAAINEYFANPELDKEKREILVREQLYKVDGDSGRRLAQGIADFIERCRG